MTNTKVNFVNSKNKYRPQELSAHSPKSTMSRRKMTPASGHKNRCNRCGRLHNKDKSNCPAANQRCHNCGMLGHFAVVCKNKRKVRHVKAESSHSDYSNESSETEDSEEEFYLRSNVIDNSTTDVSNVTQAYIVEQSNTNSEDQQDTDKSIDESIVDVKSDNKEEKLYDEPELVYKEDTQEEKAEVNQHEHVTERVNAGDNQEEMAPKGDHSKGTAEEAEELFISAIEKEGETESDFSRSQWQLPLKTCGMYVTHTLDMGAQANILPQHIYYSSENRPRLHKTNIKL